LSTESKRLGRTKLNRMMGEAMMAARHLDRLTDALIAARDRAQELGLLADGQDGR
jgi:hypothetical protein